MDLSLVTNPPCVGPGPKAGERSIMREVVPDGPTFEQWLKDTDRRGEDGEDE